MTASVLEVLRRLAKRERLSRTPKDGTSQGTRTPGPSTSWRDELASWPEARLEAFEERAAIIEAEAGLSRDEAERGAFESLKDHNGRNGNQRRNSHARK